MRWVATFAALTAGLGSLTAAAQTCPPNDPLCTTASASPGKGKPAESPAPDPAAPAPAAPAVVVAKADEQAGKQKSAEDADIDKDSQKKESKSLPQRGVITLSEVTITGRIQKPIAAVDVNRISPRLTLAELRQPFLDRIEKVIYSDPF